MLNESIEDKLEDNIEIDSNGCWIWLKYKSKKGYGQIRYNGRMRRVHRVSYECYIGNIPVGLTIDHLCKVRACCNPGHLEPVTQSENAKRGDYSNNGKTNNYHASKTHCSNGHEFIESNVYKLKNRRVCLTCRRKVDKARSPRKKKTSANINF